MTHTHCPTCGRTLPKAKAVPQSVDTSQMTDAEVFAHFKKTALVEDLRFFLQADLSPELRAKAEWIRKPTKAAMIELYACLRMERAHGVARWNAPEQFTAEWLSNPGKAQIACEWYCKEPRKRGATYCERHQPRELAA